MCQPTAEPAASIALFFTGTMVAGATDCTYSAITWHERDAVLPLARTRTPVHAWLPVASLLLPLRPARSHKFAPMDQTITLAPAFAAMLAAGLGAALGWVGLFQRRAVGVLAHAGLAIAIATSMGGAVSLRAWALSRLGPDHAMTTVIAGVCLLGATIALRNRPGLARLFAAAASVLFTALVAMLAGSGEPELAIGAALVALVALAAPDPPVVALPRSRAGGVSVNVPQHSSARLP
jgi:hypothetical protein